MASQIITDRTAKKLWLIFGVVSVSAIPALTLTTVNYVGWNAEIATQVGTILVAWAGALASLLGLSRFAPSGSGSAPFVEESVLTDVTIESSSSSKR